MVSLVDYIYNFLIPYADMPEFTTCVLKALEKTGHPISRGSVYEEPAKSCKLVNDCYCAECDE